MISILLRPVPLTKNYSVANWSKHHNGDVGEGRVLKHKGFAPPHDLVRRQNSGLYPFNIIGDL